MKRGAVIGIVAAAALVVAGGVTALILTQPPSADAAADQYLHALSKGDFATVEGMLTKGDGDPSTLKSAFLGASGYISGYSVKLHGTDADRTAHADVRLGGRPAVVSFALTQQDGRWKVSDNLASLQVATTIGDSVRVGDALVPAGSPVALLPAVYPVTAAPDGLLAGEATVDVTNQAPVKATVNATLSPDATRRAQEQLNLYADDCAKTAKAVPDNCGLRVPWGADLATLSAIAFRIDHYPAVTLSDDGRSFAAVGGEIVATATGTKRDGTSGSFTYKADDWALRGGVSFTGDEMVLSVR